MYFTNNQRPNFPPAFSGYRTYCDKVYGCILLSEKSDKILLVKGRKAQKWSFPKGHKERNECQIECAKRELYEETGIQIGDQEPVSYVKFNKEGGSYYIYSVSDEFRVFPQDCYEIEDVRWFSLNTIPELSVNIDVKGFYRMATNKC